MNCIICKTKVISNKNSLCYFCWDNLVFFDNTGVINSNVVAVIDYNEAARNLIHIFKYKSPWLLCDLFTNWISLIYSELIKSCDVILPVPIHKHKLMIRGYNQVAVLAKKLAKKYKKQCLLNVLIKNKNTKSQSLLDKKLRALNVIDTFSLRNPINLENKKVLLLDDVITTGSTISECIKTIKSNSNTASINALCIAITQN